MSDFLDAYVGKTLITRLARIIDTEGAYSKYYSSTSLESELPLTSRQKYFQSKYEIDILTILNFIKGMTKEQIDSEIAKHSDECCKRLNIPPGIFKK